ncbi:MAG: SDR family NAD(P)-dependent oxidoreductase, partial [Synechococcaceae cyanobacterium SM2_3_1]|nr:SDR family NAD(P)-dependent oxidoreductase [Synechococcaceae cyanobacterium SM2_3_1]
NRAQQKFQDYPFIRYQVLDLERDPTPQGYERHSHDLIVAANVVHATKDLRQSLSHLLELLAPGGMLILLEATLPQRWLDLVFGLQEGWWRFEDTDLRPHYPLLDQEQWQALLTDVGFAQTQVIKWPGSESSSQAVIMAHAATPTSSSRHWLIFADRGGVGLQLAKRLRTEGDNYTLVYAGSQFAEQGTAEFCLNPAAASDYDQLLQIQISRNLNVQGVVHLWSLDVLQHADDRADDHFTQGCGSLLYLLQALGRQPLPQPPMLRVVTQGSQPIHSHDSEQPNLCPSVPAFVQSPLWGMGKVIALEYPELNCVRIDLDPFDPYQTEALLTEIWSRQIEEQVAFRHQIRYVARLQRHRLSLKTELDSRLVLPNAENFELDVHQKGSLENLYLRPCTRRPPGPGEVEVEVKATGLNFRDVLNALGLYPGEAGSLGLECAGVIVAVGPEVTDLAVGEAVIALVGGCFSHWVTVHAQMVVPKPAQLSYEEAATIPSVFLTAYYALDHLAHISSADRVLIHAGAGGVGQAAIQLAQLAGAEVFTTASSGKWDFLKAKGVKHVLNSRDLTFADQIQAITNGAGVNIVLNSLAGDFVTQSFSVLANKGRFIEIGKRDILQPEQVANFRPDVSYFLVDLVQTSIEQPHLIQSMLKDLLQLFQLGKLTPLPKQVFPIEAAVSAFRHMQKGKHVGKIVISQSECFSATEPGFAADATYLITGGLGGLGLLIAEWMAERGAQHLILISRRPAEESDVIEKLEKIQKTGAQVIVAQADVSRLEQMEAVINNITQTMPPLRGVIHAAGLLSDGILQQQTWEKFAEVWAPKVQGTIHLHKLTLKQPLDFFLLFSSTAALLGSAGQANHASANAFMDAFAFWRQGQGLPGMSINWGAWSKIGEAAERGADRRVEEKGMGSITPGQGLEILSHLLGEGSAQIGVAPIHWESLTKVNVNSPVLMDFFVDLQTKVSQDQVQTIGIASTTSDDDDKETLETLLALEENLRQERLMSYLAKKISTTLGFSTYSSLDSYKSLGSLGVDSLVSVELRNQIRMDLNLDVPLEQLIGNATIHKLVSFMLEQITQKEIVQQISEPVDEEMEEITL